MIKPKVPVAKEGYPFIALSAFLTLVFANLEWSCLSLIGILTTLFILYFFRDPERFIPDTENGIISPADGKVIVIEEQSTNPFTEQECIKLSIFMNVFNVHVNRIPMNGTVDKVIFKPGTFYSADSEKGAEYNENCATVITTEQGEKIAFVQVAGLIARRIVCWLEKEDKVKRGTRYGLIRFGSRVDLYLPKTSTTNVKLGQKVVAGETILASLQR